MRELQPFGIEPEAIRTPRLFHGLMAAAGNGLRYFIDRIDYELNPDDNASPPTRRPNHELREWLDRSSDN